MGDTVSIKQSANLYANSTKTIPSWVKAKTYLVNGIMVNKVKLQEINSWVYSQDVIIVSSCNSIGIGNFVRIKGSATTWATGQPIPTWVKSNNYVVSEVNGDKILLDKTGICSWINKAEVDFVR